MMFDTDKLPLYDNTDTYGRFTANGQTAPKPPKKGEVMICQICGEPILPNQFSKNKIERKKEIKWHLHHNCYRQMMFVVDMNVKGIIQERKGLMEIFEEDEKKE